MRAKLTLFALSTCVAFGQDVSRVFQLHHIDKEQDLNEFATMIRTVADSPKLSADFSQKTISVTGAPVQIAVAEWMFTELDRQTLPEFATKEFKVPNKEDDVVRIFFLRHTATIQDFQEAATAIRTVPEIRRVFTFNAPRALTVRGTADQVAATEWLVRELDQPAGAKRADSRTYQMIDTSREAATAMRVFYLSYTSTIQAFQEVATLVRTVAEVRRVFTYNAPKALIVRGTPDQVALVGWFANELGRPVTAGTASQTYQYEANDRLGENLVRIFYVKDTATVAAFQQVATQIRETTKMRRVFTYNETRALALRGTAAQLATAEQMLEDRAQQVASK
jgi:type II secretory pathway component GspD/PulD (secretin)